MTKQPNILLVMADQLAGPLFRPGGHPVLRTPHIDQLAMRGTAFDRAYCNFPICAPSRFSMMSGRLPHAIEAYDNASEFPASIPTMAHYLAALGYRTILCGKMHFIGPDQLHGYEERLTTDIYPSDFSWTPDFLKGPSYRPTGLSMRPVIEAGPCVRTMQIDYDDEVEFRGAQKLYDLARDSDERPFFLTISFTHPHPPFVTGEEHWGRYRHEKIDMPGVPPIPLEELDEHSRWLHEAHAQNLYTVTDEHVRNARHAYYGMVSYIDDKLGRIMQTLKACGLAENTVVVFTADHGEMLGERGMWYKQTFFEWSSRVPLIVSMPHDSGPRRVGAPVSLVDLLPTFLDLANDGRPLAPSDPLDGHSLMPLINGDDDGQDREVISEYSSEGVRAASRMVCRGAYKYIFTRGLPPQLFDLERDPDELNNLAGQASFASVCEVLHARLVQDWDPDDMHERILASQRRRLFLADVAQRSGHAPNWSYQPFVDASRQYVRGGGGAGPTSAKGRARLPFVPPAAPDKPEGSSEH